MKKAVGSLAVLCLLFTFALHSSAEESLEGASANAGLKFDAAEKLDQTSERPTVTVPTPFGWTQAKEGSAKAGFYKGLDSGAKTVFAGIEYLPVKGLELDGGWAAPRTPYGYAAEAVGYLLSIPASILGGVVGAPIGAVAGIIAEKANPGSTQHWFTF